MIQPQEMETLQNLFLNGMTPPGKLKKKYFWSLQLLEYQELFDKKTLRYMKLHDSGNKLVTIKFVY